LKLCMFPMKSPCKKCEHGVQSKSATKEGNAVFFWEMLVMHSSIEQF
jgi:hypothetical protein